MRLYLKLSKNREPIPFSYQHYLTGVIHKWIGGENVEHGTMSLYSFSWLQNTKTISEGISLTNDSYFYISAHEQQLIKSILAGLLKDPSMFCGIAVKDVQITETPYFENQQKFYLGSPVFIKRREDGKERHFIYNDKRSDVFLTETIKAKLTKAGLPSEGIQIEFDKEFYTPKTKLIDYKGIQNRANMCPIIIKGTPEQIGFAWNVGVGNSTGIGFGSLK